MMTIKYLSLKTISYIVFSLVLTASAAAQQPAPQKAAAPCCAKQQPKPKPAGTVMKGKAETLVCKLGTEDRHARIAVELIGGRTKSIAYYSKWKPRTCSVHIVRDDAYSRWEDTGHVTIVTLKEEKGSFLIDHEKQYVKFLFRDIDRERFCGMPGKITGSLTVTRGRAQCELEGVMDEYVMEPAPDGVTESPAPAAATVTLQAPSAVK
jgi:hypothetical protein